MADADADADADAPARPKSDVAYATAILPTDNVAAQTTARTFLVNKSLIIFFSSSY